MEEDKHVLNTQTTDCRDTQTIGYDLAFLYL